MELNYSKAELTNKILDHPFNSMTNGEHTKGIRSMNKKQLYLVLKELDTLSDKFASSTKFNKIDNKEPNDNEQSNDEPEDEESDIVEQDEQGEESEQEGDNEEPPVANATDYLRKRKEKLYKDKQKNVEIEKEKLKKMEQKEWQILEDVEEPKEEEKKYTKRQATEEVQHLKKQIKKLVDDELKPINLDIKKYNRNGLIYPFEEKKYGVIEIFENAITEFNEELNAIMDDTKFKSDEDETEYFDYVQTHMGVFIDTIEKKINRTFT